MRARAGGASRAKNGRMTASRERRRFASSAARAYRAPRAQHMRGSGSPTSMSIDPRSAVARYAEHRPGRFRPNLADAAAPLRRPVPRAARRAPHRRIVAARRRQAICPSLAMCSGSRPRISHAPRTSSRSGIASSTSTTPQSASRDQFVECRRDAAARRIAHPAQRSPATHRSARRRTARPSAYPSADRLPDRARRAPAES